MEDDHNSRFVQPLIHSFSSQNAQALNGNITPTSVCENSLNINPSCFILIPDEDKDGNHRELLQKVYVYPQGSISTVYEKSPHQNILKETDDQVLRVIDNVRKENFCIKKKGSIFGSTNSIASGRQSAESSKILNRDESYFPVPFLTPNVNLEFSQKFNYLNVSNNYFDKDNLSDNSSYISNASDLSFYNDEYAAIKKVISDIPVTHQERKAVYLHSANKASQTNIKYKEQDFLINSLQLSKEDLDIQIQRLSTQLQQTIREKETSSEQFEIIQAKLFDSSKKDQFLILKDKVALEGQYEALLHEHENCHIDKNLLQVKVFELQTKLFEKDKEIAHYQTIQDGFENLITELKKKKSDETNEFVILQGEYQNNIDRLCKLEKELESDRNNLVQNEIKLSNAELEIIALKQSNDELQEVCKIQKSKEKFYNNERRSLESKISELYLQVVSLKDSQESLQTEFKKLHESKTDLQKQLTEARASITSISVDRDRIKAEMERLNVLMEKNKTGAVREKLSLLEQLEELEADMREREAAMAKYENNDGQLITVEKERVKKLEDVNKRFQMLKIKMGEIQRENELIIDEIKHRKILQNKNETDICGLRKELVITQEKIKEKEVSIFSLNSQLQEVELKFKSSVANIMEKEKELAKLKEDNLELNTLLSTANDDKILVDNAISKLKEDMNKLTANHFRMKHDVVAKERQIELLHEEKANLSCLKLELSEKLQNHKEVDDLKERNKLLEANVNSLKVEIKRLESKEVAAGEKINSLDQTFKKFVSERKRVDCELKLCNEQIATLQVTNDTYTNKLQLKNQEISSSMDRIFDMEKDYQDLTNKNSHLNEKITNFQLKEEEFSGTLNQLKKSIEDLKVNLKMEILAKSSLEARHTKIEKEFFSQKNKYEDQVENLENALSSIKKELCECKNFSGNTAADIFKMKKQNIQYPPFRALEYLDLDSSSAMQTGLSIHVIKDATDLVQGHEEIICKRPFYKSKTLNVSNILNCNSQSLEQMRNLKKRYRKISKFKYRNRFANFSKVFDDHDISLCNFLHIGKSLENKSKKVITLSSQISELKEKINNLKYENSNLTASLEVKNESISLLQKESNDCKTNMLMKSKECQEWKLRYEGLCDFIPQKDTNNIKQVVALHHSQFQIFNNMSSVNRNSVSHEKSETSKFYASCANECKITKSQSLDRIFNDDVYESAHLPFSDQHLKGKNIVAISPTMTDQQIFKSKQDLHPFPADLCQEGIDCFSMQQCNKEDELFNNNQFSLTNLPLEKKINEDICSLSSRNLSEIRQQEIVDILTELERKLAAKEDKIIELNHEASQKVRHITELHCKFEHKELEFQNKQKQYISNIRLLTRKLKEHLKGRRECEKELEAVMQESKQKLECEMKRFHLLKERNIEVDSICQQLNFEKINCDLSINNLSKEIDQMKESLSVQQSINIDLQRNVGHMEELKRSLNSSMSHELLLENEIKQLKDFKIKIEEKLEKEVTEKLLLSRQCNEFCLNNDFLNKNIKDLNEEVSKKEKTNELLKLEISKKVQEISNLKEALASMKEQLVNSNMSISSSRDKEDLLTSENGNFKKEIEALKTNLLQKQISLEESLVKITILQEELKLKEDIIFANKQEIESLQFQLIQANENHSAALEIMNMKIVNATEIENSLNEKLKSIHDQKLYYQNLTIEFRTSLNCALSHLRNLKRPISPTPTPVLPSPSPLDTTSLLKLMEKCSGPPSSAKCLSSFTKRISALRKEVANVQQELKNDNEN